MQLRKGIFIVNGVERTLVGGVDDSLANVLRRFGLTSVKIGCGVGQCGACTVLLDGKPERACVKKFKNIPEFTKIETVEGLGTADHLHPLQMAWMAYGGVQCGFCTPGFIMSAKGLLDVNPAPTRAEVKDWFTKNHNLCRCTGYKQLVDAVMAAAEVMRGDKPRESLEFKMPEDGHIYNTRYPRPASLAKVMGVCDYGNDLGMKFTDDALHMGVTWSKYRHANILSVDTTEAEGMPGVETVLTAKDIKGSNSMGFPPGHKRARYTVTTMPVLCSDKVRRYGDAIAIVLADTEAHARAAADAVKVEYEELPVYDSYLEACLPDAVSIAGDGTPNVLLYQPLIKGDDTREIFDEAEKPGSDMFTAEGSFSSTREPHMPIEPWSLQAYFDEDDVLTIHDKTQALFVGKMLVPRAIGISPQDLRCIENPTGATFGAGMAWDCTAMIGAAALAVHRPVTWTMTYAESQRYTGKRAAAYSNARIACDKDGKIVALEGDFGMDHGCNANTAGNVELKTLRFFGYPYQVPNIRAITRGGLSNQPYAIAYRAYGSPQAYTVTEQLVDMVAEKAGIDPLEFRYRNVAQPGDLAPYMSPYTSYPMTQLLDAIHPYYDESREWKKKPTPANIKRGVGVSCGGYHLGSPDDKAEVMLQLNPDGSVTNFNSWEAQGQGADIGTLVNTHESLRPLGLPPEKIHLYQNDTKYCPVTGPAARSRCHYMAGNATQDAADKLMNAMRKPDGTYRTYDEMVAEIIPTSYMGTYSTIGKYTNLDPDTGKANPTPDCLFLASVARVEVNTDTGVTRCVALHSATDVGFIGNYLAVDGQAYGGMCHSIGFALSEDYDDGKKKCGTPLGCGMLQANEMPDDVTFKYIENPRENGPHGSGGASESFQSAGHASVLNAIYDATGVRIHELPATPDKMKAGLKAKAEGKEYAPEKYYLGDDFSDVLDDIIENPVNPPVATE